VRSAAAGRGRISNGRGRAALGRARSFSAALKARCHSRRFLLTLPPQSALLLDETGDGIDTLAGAQIAEHEGARAAHALGVALHDRDRSPDVWPDTELFHLDQHGAR